jgi:hypothetical protein
MLTELTPDTEHQGDFLDIRDTARSQRLMVALDAINRRLGRDTVFSAASGVKRDIWLAKRHHPDQGGSHQGFLQVKDAYDRALAAWRRGAA